jgi:hypothetical protein
MFQITISLEACEVLVKMPVTQTRTFKLDDREFSIIDSEYLKEVCELAKLKIYSIKP